MAIDVSFADYVRGVRTSAQGAVVLSARLEWAAPADITPDEKKALRAVKARAAEVQEVLGDRDRLAPGKMRPLLVAFANDWSALYDALTAKSRLPSHVSNRGPEAAMLSMSLFPDGASFTQLDAETAWVEGQRRIVRIHDEQLTPKIEALVGDGFIEAVKNSTGILGNALGTGRQKRTIPSTTALQEALVRFGKAVARLRTRARLAGGRGRRGVGEALPRRGRADGRASRGAARGRRRLVDGPDGGRHDHRHHDGGDDRRHDDAEAPARAQCDEQREHPGLDRHERRQDAGAHQRDEQRQPGRQRHEQRQRFGVHNHERGQRVACRQHPEQRRQRCRLTGPAHR
jgi:hypothetical protein